MVGPATRRRVRSCTNRAARHAGVATCRGVASIVSAVITCAGIMTHAFASARRLPALFAALPALAAMAATAATAADPSRPGFTYTIEPAPAWVVPAREQPGTRVERAPLHYRVIDEQTKVDDKGATRYAHIVRVVDEAAGLAVATQVEVEFDPAYQALAWHHFDIVRDGKRLAKLDRKRIQLLQRETQLERRIYDGRVTASVVLDDVRVGDQIDFAYTLRGSNPVFDGRYVGIEWMTSHRGPVATYQHRLLAPEARRIQIRTGAPDAQVESRVERGVRETVIRRESVPQLQVDRSAPYGVLLKQEIQLSEFADWADVARWGQALFVSPPGSAAALDRKAAEIRAQTAEREQRVLAALRFVQADVRYLGTETGLNSHRPAPPEKVLEQRFGDCKDKVALLVALLRRMDIPATPVLVSTFMRGRVDTLLPSPLAFDHVIARVDLDGRTYWLDATRAHQTGPLPARQAVGFDQGLPLPAGTSGIAALPTAYAEQRMAVQDTFRVARFADAVALEARITYRGELADGIREALATRNVAEIESQAAAPYARAYPKLNATAPMRVEPSPDDDAVTLVLAYTIPDFWRFPEQKTLSGDIVQWSIIEALRIPHETGRRDPLVLAYPGVYRHTTVIEYPEDVYAAPTSQRTDDGDAHFSVGSMLDVTPRRTEYVTEARLRVDQLEPANWNAYVAQFNKLAPRASVTATVSALSLSRLELLRRDLKDTEDAMRAHRLRINTSTQYQSTLKSIVLSAQLAEGRLAPALRAQALTARAVQYDNLGRYDDAKQDLDQALALAPDVAETLNAAAVNALQLRDPARALTLAGAVLAHNPNDADARSTRAIAAYFARDYAAAKADLNELLKDRAQVRRGYPIVWLALASRAASDAAAGDKTFGDAELPTDWPRPLVDWARGKASADAVIASARSGASAAERLCEAYFYIGERYMVEGDTARAAEYFQKAVDQGVTEFLEDGSSRNRLAMLKRR
jgi:lipoprotein NlpI